MFTVLPEGWGFFTRDPQEPRVGVFRRGPESDTWREESARNTTAAYLFGASRAARTRGIEIATLLQSVPDAAWVECTDPLEHCAAAIAQPFPVITNLAASPTLCGDLLLRLQEPVPWAWSRSARTIEMPSRATAMKVECP